MVDVIMIRQIKNVNKNILMLIVGCKEPEKSSSFG